MGKIKEIFIDIMNNNRGVDQDADLDYQYDEYLIEYNKIKRQNKIRSLEQDVSDKQINTVLTNIKLK
jgi:hypothetical protein